MEESAKYLIHADVTADGVVERSDVVGAIYGQTEGLLGDELDLRHLQEASKVGRIDVDVDSEGGRSFGELTIATSLDRVETAVLAAALETISRVGPCRAEVRVTGIEDVRAAKRRRVVERAKELLAESFDEPAVSTRELLEEVRRSIRVEDVTDYEGLPAGPNVADSDAVIVVEGRADVLQLLEYGIKNAVAVEGTNVPEAVAELSRERTVTAFLDGDRGGDLILKELAQVGDVDHVALAPPDRSVEDLSRSEVTAALREKVPYDAFAEEGRDAIATEADGGAAPVDARLSTPPEADDPAADGEEDATDDGDADATDAGTGEDDATAGSAGEDGSDAEAGEDTADGSAGDAAASSASADDRGGSDAGDGTEAEADADAGDGGDGGDGGPAAVAAPESLRDHVRAVVEEDAGTVRLLDDDAGVLAEAPAGDAFDALEGAEEVPWAVVLDGALTQRVLDVAAQRGVAQVVARETGDFVKRPTDVRVRTAEQLRAG